MFNLLIVFLRLINYEQILFTFGLLSSFSFAIDLFLEYLQDKVVFEKDSNASWNVVQKLNNLNYLLIITKNKQKIFNLNYVQ